MSLDIKQIAQAYIDAGFDPCPLEPRSKAIRTTGWNEPDKHFTASDFAPDSNIGLRLGVPGTARGNRCLIDGDLDEPKASLIADLFFPATGATFGRAGKPFSHMLYVCDEPILYVKYDGLGGSNDTLVELRGITLEGKATQTVVPHSIWVNKKDSNHTELVEWSAGCAIERALHVPEGAILRSAARNTAISLLIGRDFPGAGNHHLPRLALAGFLLRIPGLLEDQVLNIGLAVMRLVDGDEDDWRLTFKTTLAKKNAGKRFTAGTALAKALGTNGPQIVERIRDWFKADTPEQEDAAKATALARVFLDAQYVSEQRSTLYFQQGSFYRFEGAAYAEHEVALLRSEVYRSFPDAQKKVVDEIMDAVKAYTALSRHRASPSWLIEGQSREASDILACRNGLLHVPTGDMIPPTPSFFTFNQIEIDYDPSAPAPIQFLKFLDSLFPEGDTEAIEALQETFGYALTPDRRFQKIPLWVGPKRGGKGTLAKILKRLVGHANACNPSLNDLGGLFGRQSLIGKTLAIIGDLRLGPRSDLARIAEVLLSISGEDDQTVPRKHLPDWHGRLAALFVVLSNELPNLHDTSGALASRFLIVQLSQSFFGREDQTLAQRILATELAGILNWALEGRKRLYARGHFVQPQSATESLKALEELASPVGAFLREHTRKAQGATLSHEELYKAWVVYCASSGIAPGRIQEFGRDVRAALPWVTSFRPSVNVNPNRKQHWKGIALIQPQTQWKVPF
jgi:putative DNA primase/helicase